MPRKLFVVARSFNERAAVAEVSPPPENGNFLTAHQITETAEIERRIHGHLGRSKSGKFCLPPSLSRNIWRRAEASRTGIKVTSVAIFQPCLSNLSKHLRFPKFFDFFYRRDDLIEARSVPVSASSQQSRQRRYARIMARPDVENRNGDTPSRIFRHEACFVVINFCTLPLSPFISQKSIAREHLTTRYYRTGRGRLHSSAATRGLTSIRGSDAVTNKEVAAAE